MKVVTVDAVVSASIESKKAVEAAVDAVIQKKNSSQESLNTMVFVRDRLIAMIHGDQNVDVSYLVQHLDITIGFTDPDKCKVWDDETLIQPHFFEERKM